MFRIVLGSMVAVVLIVGGLFVGRSPNDDATRQDTRQDEVALRGASVMPFDLERTTHTFTDEPYGGTETVVVDNAKDIEQTALIRTHLSKESTRFATGDFSAPAAIHGAEMPGLRELEAGNGQLNVSYADTSLGGIITYSSREPTLVAAIQKFFAAQRGDHGSHASS